MNYSLAKKLKDNGFPQETKMRHYHPIHGMAVGIPHPDTLIDPEVVALPTLEELIEACGKSHCEDNLVIWFYDGLFMAGYLQRGEMGKHYVDGYPTHEKGSTLEEAVANLWLAINKK